MDGEYDSRSQFLANDRCNFFEIQCPAEITNKLESEPSTSKGWEIFDVFAAGASGPRSFATLGFDLHLTQLIKSGTLIGERWLLGGSTAALRFCAILSSSIMHGESLTVELKEHFMSMVYREGDSPSTLAPMMSALYRRVLPETLAPSVVHHPTVHLCIMVAQILPPFDQLPDWQLKALFWVYLGANFLSPRVLTTFQRPLCFYTGPQTPPFLREEDNITCIPITTSNIYQVLSATTCLPFISPHCRYIEGVGSGLFFDGALINYHLNLRPKPGFNLLLLADGPGPEFKQTLWDSYVPYRTAPCEYKQYISVVYPTQAYVDAVPAKKLPNTFDYFNKAYIHQPDLRRAHWEAVFQISIKFFPFSPGQLIRMRGQASQHAVTAVLHCHVRNRTADSVLVDYIDGCEDQGGREASVHRSDRSVGCAITATDAELAADSVGVRLLIQDQRRSVDSGLGTLKGKGIAALSLVVVQQEDSSAWTVDLNAYEEPCKKSLTESEGVEKYERSGTAMKCKGILPLDERSASAMKCKGILLLDERSGTAMKCKGILPLDERSGSAMKCKGILPLDERSGTAMKCKGILPSGWKLPSLFGWAPTNKLIVE
ncbi:hypothetical protein CEUSTIGMA_g5349.t1 [Chlamydomonas eustigma]|uniref:PNPLA domain-containing protein n=1 Tax=Chlamydomonas eustigma TaxID=1157962 RepID=A0A250X495_9CHLO|nr:hypothetical protein CEUSTIGMA_g5349.t1 [Chlamydomonas eustigma]|eukprot:GAX77907.1 hypothetical protein CEUSTIGMA_g5349.t1 [Chlamydomonas eustigma]